MILLFQCSVTKRSRRDKRRKDGAKLQIDEVSLGTRTGPIVSEDPSQDIETAPDSLLLASNSPATDMVSISPRGTVLQACTLTSSTMAAIGLMIREVGSWILVLHSYWHVKTSFSFPNKPAGFSFRFNERSAGRRLHDTSILYDCVSFTSSTLLFLLVGLRVLPAYCFLCLQTCFLSQITVFFPFNPCWDQSLSPLITVGFEMWHLELITGLVILVSSSRYLLLKAWPDFSESSEAANRQVHKNYATFYS